MKNRILTIQAGMRIFFFLSGIGGLLFLDRGAFSPVTRFIFISSLLFYFLSRASSALRGFLEVSPGGRLLHSALIWLGIFPFGFQSFLLAWGVHHSVIMDLFWVVCIGQVILRGAIQMNQVDWSHRQLVMELDDSEHRFKQLAEALPQLVWMSTASGRVDFMNRRWYEYTGRTIRADSIGQWQEVVHPEDQLACQSAWVQAHEAGETFEIEARLRKFDGSFNWYLCRMVPVHSLEGHILRWYGTASDIHALKTAHLSRMGTQPGIKLTPISNSDTQALKSS